jgi:hypothetical protein
VKFAHLYEVKLVDDRIFRGVIVHKDDTAIRLKLVNGQTVYLSLHGIALIKDLGWQKIKR